MDEPKVTNAEYTLMVAELLIENIRGNKLNPPDEARMAAHKPYLVKNIDKMKEELRKKLHMNEDRDIVDAYVLLWTLSHEFEVICGPVGMLLQIAQMIHQKESEIVSNESTQADA